MKQTPVRLDDDAICPNSNAVLIDEKGIPLAAAAKADRKIRHQHIGYVLMPFFL